MSLTAMKRNLKNMVINLIIKLKAWLIITTLLVIYLLILMLLVRIFIMLIAFLHLKTERLNNFCRFFHQLSLMSQILNNLSNYPRYKECNPSRNHKGPKCPFYTFCFFIDIYECGSTRIV